MLNELDLKLFEILNKNIDKTEDKNCYYLYLGNTINHFTNNRVIDKKLGQYPTTNTILLYCIDRDVKIAYSDYGLKINFSKDTDGYQEIIYEFDITKEIEEYTDKEKQELIEFLLSI